MEKVILTVLPGLFVKSTPWKNAHKYFFEGIYKETNDKSMLMWMERGEDFIKGVNAAMLKIMPKAIEQERAEETRKRFLEAILKGIKLTPSLKNNEIINCFEKLKTKYKIALITTSRLEAINLILEELEMTDFFDIIEAQVKDENQNQIVEKFIKRCGKPLLFIGGDRNDAYYFCKAQGIKCVYANLENKDGNKDVLSIKTVEELKKFL
jgi:phosphoglycolate phosphatase-like HAD superfamily hydrolase